MTTHQQCRRIVAHCEHEYPAADPKHFCLGRVYYSLEFNMATDGLRVCDALQPHKAHLWNYELKGRFQPKYCMGWKYATLHGPEEWEKLRKPYYGPDVTFAPLTVDVDFEKKAFIVTASNGTWQVAMTPEQIKELERPQLTIEAPPAEEITKNTKALLSALDRQTKTLNDGLSSIFKLIAHADDVSLPAIVSALKEQTVALMGSDIDERDLER